MGGLLGETEFGWEEKEINDVGSKINFAYLQTMYAANPRWLGMLEKVIREATGVTEITWKLVDEYDPKDGRQWGYIDHQSSAEEGKNTEMFDSEEDLKAFLFGSGSYIHEDNDNH